MADICQCKGVWGCKDEKMIKERPIIFSDVNIEPIQKGKKTQTRRVIKKEIQHVDIEPQYMKNRWGFWNDTDMSNGKIVKCPYGIPGDRLWVRETWADVNSEEGPSLLYRSDGCLVSWHDFSKTFDRDYGAGPSMDYKAYPGDYTMWWSDLLRGEPEHRWRTPLYMPRWASRIDLEVVSVRVERLQNITEEDARAEGCFFDDEPGCPEGFCEEDRPKARDEFIFLWNKIHKKDGYVWTKNPWVWVIEFKRLWGFDG